jgi:NAD(P)-dependent dehydrogenase (short-subunit alcohol dehydrogenase family)
MGTVLLTGANSSLALPAVDRLLSTYPAHTAILTVRNDTASDPNTAKLLAIIAKYPDAKVSLRKLDLSSNSQVEEFAATLASEIKDGKFPRITTILCNAMTWSLGSGLQHAPSGTELSMQVNHIAQLSLVLRLLGSLDTAPGKGRIVFLSSEVHEPKAAGFAVYPPDIPADLDAGWARPGEDKKGEEVGRGFYRYAVSKLAVVVCSYALARRLKTVSTPHLCCSSSNDTDNNVVRLRASKTSKSWPSTPAACWTRAPFRRRTFRLRGKP